jgi:hypothetical protein
MTSSSISPDVSSYENSDYASPTFDQDIGALYSLTTWPSTNYQLLSEYANTLSLSDPATLQLLIMVPKLGIRLITCVHASMQVSKFDKALCFPTTVRELRNAEKAVFDNESLTSCTFEDIPMPIVPSTGLPMIRVTADLKCVTYKLMSVAQDLINDGDHGQHAVFKYTEEKHPITNARQFGEMWTGDWWKREQAMLHDGASLLVPIIYMDETPVTHNGRNLHPIYMSLGNLYLESRWHSIINSTLQFFIFIFVQTKIIWKAIARFYAKHQRRHQVQRLRACPEVQKERSSQGIGTYYI